MATEFRENFLDIVCPWDWAFGLLFGVNVVLFVLLVFSLVIARPPPDTEVISVLAGVFIFGSLVMTGGLLRVCRTRDR